MTADMEQSGGQRRLDGTEGEGNDNVVRHKRGKKGREGKGKVKQGGGEYFLIWISGEKSCYSTRACLKRAVEARVGRSERGENGKGDEKEQRK